MPSTTRRSLLASLGTAAVGSVAGCTSLSDDDPPAGSLRFENEHTVPHAISMRVVDVGERPGDEPGTVEGDPIVAPAQRQLSASTVVDPGASQTYEGVFTRPLWYAVRFTIDGDEPEDGHGAVAFNPAPTDGEAGSTLVGRVNAGGEFLWSVSSTENPGPFA